MLYLEQEVFIDFNHGLLLNPPTSWYWNIRIGDKVRINNSGIYYTVVGPMQIPNPELFVNVGEPGPTAVPPLTADLRGRRPYPPSSSSLSTAWTTITTASWTTAGTASTTTVTGSSTGLRPERSQPDLVRVDRDRELAGLAHGTHGTGNELHPKPPLHHLAAAGGHAGRPRDAAAFGRGDRPDDVEGNPSGDARDCRSTRARAPWTSCSIPTARSCPRPCTRARRRSA